MSFPRCERETLSLSPRCELAGARARGAARAHSLNTAAAHAAAPAAAVCIARRGMLLLRLFSSFSLLSLVSALPPLPHGSRLALTAPGWGRGVGTGGAVWPAAEVLARWLLDERKAVQGARVLELGSGTGAVGLFAAGCGASSVLLTDGDASLCSLAADNARDNAALMPDATVTTMRYRWGGSVEALGGPFDLALASDLTYEPAAHGAPVVYELVAAAPHGVYTAPEAAPSCAKSGRFPCPAWAA